MTSSRLDRGRHRAGAPRRSPAVQPGHQTDEPQALERVGPAHRARPTRTRGRRVAGMVTGFGTAAVLTATAAWAIITAIATGSGTVGTATLSLTQASNGAGLSNSITGMMPNDVQNRFVTVRNDGSADGRALTLHVTGSPVNKLVTDATKGLQLSVTACTVAWTAATGTCGGAQNVLLASTAVSSMGTASPQDLLTSTFAAGTSQHLKVSLALPDQAETVTDGNPPADSIQNLTTTLTYTFTMPQRNGTTVNS